MINEVVVICNWFFFVAFIVPYIVRCGIKSFKYFQVLDMFYQSFQDKMRFCIAIVMLMYKQWVNGNVVRKDKNTYEIHVVLDGQLCNILMKRNVVDNFWTSSSTSTELKEDECVN